MRANKTLGFLAKSSATFRSTSFSISTQKLKALFPSLDQEPQKVSKFLKDKIVLQQLLHNSLLDNLLNQAQKYFKEDKLSNSEEAIDIIMNLIKESDLEKSTNHNLSKTLGRVYCLHAEIKSCGSLEGRAQVENSLNKASYYAEQSKDKITLDKVKSLLKTHKLNSYQVAPGESLIFEDHQSDKQSHGKD